MTDKMTMAEVHRNEFDQLRAERDNFRAQVGMLARALAEIERLRACELDRATGIASKALAELPGVLKG